MSTITIDIYDFKVKKSSIKFEYFNKYTYTGAGIDIFEKIKVENTTLTLFYEDSIKTLKEKIYLATDILPCEQYIFNDTGRVGFEVKLLTGVINNNPIDATEYIGDIPVYRDIYLMRDNLEIKNNEYTMIGEILKKNNTLCMISLKYIKIPKYEDIIYWSLVQFFPYFNSAALKDYIDSNTQNYPLLFVNRNEILKKLQEEEKILKNIYNMKYNEKFDIESRKSDIHFSIENMKVLVQMRGTSDLRNIFNIIHTTIDVPVIILNEYNIIFSKVYFHNEHLVDNSFFKTKNLCIFFIMKNVVFELNTYGQIYATIQNKNTNINFQNAKEIIKSESSILFKLFDNLKISFFKNQLIEDTYKIIQINSIITFTINLDLINFNTFIQNFTKTPFIINITHYHWVKSIEYKTINHNNGFDYYCNSYDLTPQNYIEFNNKYSEIQIILKQFDNRDFNNIIKYIQYYFSQLKPSSNKDIKNNLKLLRSIDPVNYNIKQPFTRVCQKPRQPQPVSSEKGLDVDRILHYWNMTKDEPLIYYCPNTKYPYPGFITNFHPDGNCLICCFKKKPKKNAQYTECMNTHKYEIQKKENNVKYIINSGKTLEAGRIGTLPTIINKFLVYNLSDINIISESLTLNVFQYAGKIYSVSRLIKYTKDTKIQNIPVVLFEKFMNIPVWKRKRKGQKLIKPIEVLDNPRKNSIYAKHYKRILEADSDSPIFVYNDNGSYIIIDGFHRLAHCFLKNIKNINIKFVTEKQLKRAFIRKYDIKNISFISSAVKVEGGEFDKEPFYYIMGINHFYLKENCSFLYAISDVLFDTLEEFIMDIINELRDQEFILNYSSQDLIKKITNFFIDNNISDTNNWNELFYEILPVIYDFIPIVLDYREDNINITMQHVYNDFGNIDNNFIILLKTEDKYNPIYIVIPFIYGKTSGIEKKFFNYDDQFIKIIEKLVLKKKQEKYFTLQKITDLNYGKITLITQNGLISAVEIDEKIYISIEKTKIKNSIFTEFILKKYDYGETMKFLEAYSKMHGLYSISKVFAYNGRVCAYKIGEYVNFIDAGMECFNDVKIEIWNYAPEIIINAKSTKKDPILTHYLNYKFNDYAYFKEEFFKKYKDLKFPLELEDFASEDNQIMIKAIVEESQNPLKCELFRMGIYNFKKLYLNKHNNENIYIKLKYL